MCLARPAHLLGPGSLSCLSIRSGGSEAKGRRVYFMRRLIHNRRQEYVRRGVSGWKSVTVYLESRTYAILARCRRSTLPLLLFRIATVSTSSRRQRKLLVQFQWSLKQASH
ncbi:hypothetical protein BDV09DRAFT_50687 [Aspergillus tetrazonus]